MTRDPDGRYVVRCTDVSGHTLERRFDTKREAKWFRRAIREWPESEPFDENELEQIVADYTGMFTKNVGREMLLARRFDSEQ